MPRSLFSGRIGGRIILVLTALIAFTAGMFALASLFFDLDPDGHHTREWLHNSRWGWFIWRLTVYAGIACFWYYRVRPLLLTRYPDVRPRLPRTEFVVASFIIFMEIVAWNGVA